MRRFFAPEVVQTSAMDCGPAALKCLLEGFSIPVSYARLREACQTGLDGTSIDTMEAVANQLGLNAEQIMLPVDHLLLSEAKALPALVVVQQANGLTHFVVVWRRLGALLEVMDPAVGRRWVNGRRFLHDVYRHRMSVPAEAWREFAGTCEFQAALKRRLLAVDISRPDAATLVAEASQEPAWFPFGKLDAAARLLEKLVEGGGLKGSAECTRVLRELLRRPELIPEAYWSVRSAGVDEDGTELVTATGAVLVRILGTCDTQPETVSEELASVVGSETPRPGRAILTRLWESGAAVLGSLLLTAMVAVGGVLVEALLFRSLFDVSSELHSVGQRLAAITAVLLFSALLFTLDVALVSGFARLGRQLEIRLRVDFLRKIPLLGDRYFQSRLTSDMAERSHAIHKLRNLPDLARQFLMASLKMLATSGGLIWLEPSAWWIILLIATTALLPPFFSRGLLAERDLRVRNHGAGLTRFYLDAMLGLLPIRAHNAAPNILREQEQLLGCWMDSSIQLQRTVTRLEGVQLILMFGLVAMMLLCHPFEGREIGQVLLVVYWALNLPSLGQDIAGLARRYPYFRNVTLRVLEPLGAPEEIVSSSAEPHHSEHAPAIEFRNVSVQTGGHAILEHIDLRIASGEHVAIVGCSGAGKSSLFGVLLGWLKAQSGEVLTDNSALDTCTLRRSTAWVDPAVQLWNKSLFENIRYGSESSSPDVGTAIEASMLRSVLETLPEGMQTKLGEGGGLVSGGEGQRVRLARAMLRSDARLILLDEPFRGLDREKRRQLMERSRHLWHGCTMLCITHDIAETAQFDRVIVIEGGRIIEDGRPRELASRADSRYAALLRAETDARSALWSDRSWRRVSIRNGRAWETAPEPAAALPKEEVA